MKAFTIVTLFAAAALGSPLFVPPGFRVGTVIPSEERFAGSSKAGELPPTWTRVSKPTHDQVPPSASAVVVGTKPASHNSTMFPGMIFRPGKKDARSIRPVVPNPKSREWVQSDEDAKYEKTIQTRPEPRPLAAPLTGPLHGAKMLAPRGYSDDSPFEEYTHAGKHKARGLESQQQPEQQQPEQQQPKARHHQLEPRQCYACSNTMKQPPTVLEH